MIALGTNTGVRKMTWAGMNVPPSRRTAAWIERSTFAVDGTRRFVLKPYHFIPSVVRRE